MPKKLYSRNTDILQLMRWMCKRIDTYRGKIDSEKLDRQFDFNSLILSLFPCSIFDLHTYLGKR